MNRLLLLVSSVLCFVFKLIACDCPDSAYQVIDTLAPGVVKVTSCQRYTTTFDCWPETYYESDLLAELVNRYKQSSSIFIASYDSIRYFAQSSPESVYIKFDTIIRTDTNLNSFWYLHHMQFIDCLGGWYYLAKKPFLGFLKSDSGLISPTFSLCPGNLPHSYVGYFIIGKTITDVRRPGISVPLDSFYAAINALPSESRSENSVSTSINIYPNPAKKSIYINSSGVNITKICLYDISGRAIVSESVNNRKEFLWTGLNLRANTYFIKIIAEDHCFVRKVMFQ